MLNPKTILAVVVLLACSARPASAQEGPQEGPSATGDAPASDEMIASGVALRKEGQDAAALALFERAYAKHRSGRALAQIALAHQALGQWREAERGLMKAMEATDDAWVAREMAYLEQGLEAVRAHLAWLAVESNVQGAQIWVGGEPAGLVAPEQPVRVVAGTVTLDASAPGYPALRRTMTIDPGTTGHATFAFSLDAAASPATAPAPSSAGARRAGWVGVAISGGLLLAGVAAEVIRDREAQIYDDNSQCGPSGALTRYDRCGTNRDIGSAAEPLGIAAFAVSGVGLAISAGLLLGGAQPSPGRTAGRAACGVSGLGLACQGAF